MVILGNIQVEQNLWHNSNNYVGAKRMANALIFDKENGQIAEFNYIAKN